MSSKDRLEQIRQIIKIQKTITVSDLSLSFNVTEETIRRDLEKLKNEGFLNRTFGGAILNEHIQKDELHFNKRANINLEEKRKMAILFSEILQEKTTIAADASTTVMEVVKFIQNSRDVTLLTSSTAIFNQLCDSDINILSTGGIFNRSTLSLQGIVAEENIRRYHVDILLMSCKGIHLEKGIMDSKEAESEVKRVMIEQAKEVALFVDHSKFNQTAFAQLIGFERITYIITDRKPEDIWIEFFKKHKIKLIY